MIQATDTRGGQPVLSAVLSLHNRADRAEDIILDAAAVLDGLVDGAFEIVVIDDGSTDATPERLAGLSARLPRLPLRVLRHGTRRGMAAALSTGFDAVRGEVIVSIAGDAICNLSELYRLLDGLDGNTDLVIGYRDPPSGDLLRRLNNWTYNGLVNMLFGHTARDVDCGLKLLRRQVWQAVGAHVGDEAFDAELMVRARRGGFRVREVPVRQWAPVAAGQAAEPSLGTALLALLHLRRRLPRPGEHEPRVSVDQPSA